MKLANSVAIQFRHIDRVFSSECPFVGLLDSEIGRGMADAIASYLTHN